MSQHKTILRIHTARYSDYGGLDTYSAMPSPQLPIGAIEPFLFLNHHGHQVYPTHNPGLPFGPHPHKGFETVTFIVEGDLVHKDSTGFHSQIGPGGVQWMTAGRGIIHSETSSEDFLREGGPLEILQLWVNLPARLKDVAPNYIGLQAEKVPSHSLDDGKVELRLVSGIWEGQSAAISPLADVQLATASFKVGGTWKLEVAEGRTVLFYLIRGKLTVNGEPVEMRQMVQFGDEGSLIEMHAEADSLLLVGHALPHREPIAAAGPFVMNTEQEIRVAYHEYQTGKMGVWTHD